MPGSSVLCMWTPETRAGPDSAKNQSPTTETPRWKRRKSPEPIPASGPAFAVPAGSTLIVRASGGVSVDITRTGGLEPVAVETKLDSKSPAQTPAAQNAASQNSGAQEQHFSVAGDGEAHLRGAGRDLTWRFTAIPDRAPTIALAKDPEQRYQTARELVDDLEKCKDNKKAAAPDAKKPAAKAPVPPVARTA